MHVFVTGATGWIGSAATDQLLAAGHRITALTRSHSSVAALAAKGVTVLCGDLDDPDSLRRGTESADAVVHLAYKHDWSNVAASFAAERRAVETIGGTLVGSGRPFLFAAGLAGIRSDRPATETDPSPAVGPASARGGAENLALEFVERDVRVMPVRFAPAVHGMGDRGFVSTLAEVARRRGVSGYPGDGANRWAAVHRSDAARLIACGVERARAGTRLHAVAEEGITTREIAEAISRAFNLPVASVPVEKATEHFGWIGRFFTSQMAATSTATRTLLDWEPAGPSLVDDIANGAYAQKGA